MEVDAVLAHSGEVIRVLHIDDDDNVQMFLKVFIEGDKGIKVTQVQEAKDAIQLIETGAYDCLVSDYDMPGMDGITLASRVREISNIPIIIYTGRGSEEIAERAFAAGIDDYIRKENEPAHYQLVAKRIRQAVERRRVSEGYRNLFDSASDAIWVHTLEGVILDVNEVACRRLGYSKEELLGKSLSRYAEPQKIRFNNNLRKIVNEGHSVFESVQIARDGRRIPVEVSARVIKYMGVEAILSFSRDISDRKRLEAEMKARLEALQTHALSLSECNTIEEVTKTTYQILRSEMNYSFLAFGLVESDRLRFIPNNDINYDWDLECSLDAPSICTRAVATASTIIIPDVRLEHDYVKPKSGYKYLSELVVPVKIGGKVVAVINIEEEKKNRFTRDDAALLEVFSEHVGSAINRIELLNLTRRLKLRFEMLNKHAEHLAKLKDEEAVARYSLEVIEASLGFNESCFGVIEENNLKFKYTLNPEINLVPIIPLNGVGITNRAVKTGQSQLVSDTRLNPDFSKQIDPCNYLSELDVPVKIGDRVIALINLEHPNPNYFTEYDKEFIEILAENVAAALNRIKMTNDAHRQLSRLERINTYSSQISELNSVDEIAEHTFATIDELLGFGDGCIGVIEGDFLKFKYARNLDYPKWPNMPLKGKGITIRAIKTGHSQLVPDTRLDPDFIPSGLQAESLSELDVPIMADGEVVAVINLEDPRLNYFTEEDREIVELLAAQIASSIVILKKNEKLSSLHHHASVLALSKDINEVATHTLDTLRDVFNFKICSFHLLNGDSVEMISYIGFTLDGDFSQKLNGPGMIPYAMREGRVIYASDIRNYEHYAKNEIAHPENTTLSEYVIPIKMDGASVAAINLESDLLDAYSKEDQTLVETLAEHVASAFNRISSLDASRRYLARIAILNRHVGKISTMASEEEVIEYSFHVIHEVLGFKNGCYGVVEGDYLNYKYAVNPNFCIWPPLPLNGKGITIRAIRTGKSQLVHDTRLDPDFVIDVDTDEFLSELDVPVKVGGKVVSVINLEDQRPWAFNEADKEFMEVISENIASAISRIDKANKSEERFKHLLDSAPEGVTVNILGKVVYVNQSFAEMMGYTVDELLRLSVLDLTKEAYRGMVRDRTRRRALGEEVPSRYEVDLIRKGGSFISVEFNVSRIEFGGESASLTFIRDVSKEKETRELEKRINSLHEHARDLNAAQSVEEVAKETLELLQAHVRCNHLSIRSVIGEDLCPITDIGAKSSGKSMPISGKGVIARVARERRSMLVPDTRLDPDFVKGRYDSLSELAVPIFFRETLLGVLNAESLELNAFDDSDRVLMEVLASSVGAAMVRILREEVSSRAVVELTQV